MLKTISVEKCSPDLDSMPILNAFNVFSKRDGSAGLSGFLLVIKKTVNMIAIIIQIIIKIFNF